MQYRWCNDEGTSLELADLFIREASVEYISHQEIQWGRANNPREWSPDFHSRAVAEIREALQNASANSGQRIAVAEFEDRVAGFAIVLFVLDAPTPFAVLEDFLVASEFRCRGLGASFFGWIEGQVRTAGMKRLFLESGVHNERAHDFFHRVGFETCSVVMMKELDS